MGRMSSHILWKIKHDWKHQPDGSVGSFGISNFRSPGPHMESAANLRSPTTFSAEFSNRTLEQDLPIFSPQFRVPCRKNKPKNVWSKPPGWWFQPLLTKRLVSWYDYSQLNGKTKKTSKPPTSIIYTDVNIIWYVITLEDRTHFPSKVYDLRSRTDACGRVDAG
jgi:hypothetical protein